MSLHKDIVCYAMVTIDGLTANWKTQHVDLTYGVEFTELLDFHLKYLVEGGQDPERFCCLGNSIIPREIRPDLEAAFREHRDNHRKINSEHQRLRGLADRFIAERLNPDDLAIRVLKRWRPVRGEDEGELGALVEVSSKSSGERLRFKCRNIFDFGYVVNPDYAVSPGEQPGGLVNVDPDSGDLFWHHQRRPLTEFECRCVVYLDLYPPVVDGIRM